MKNYLKPIIVALCFLLSCSSTISNYTDSINDPFYNFNQIRSVGIIPLSITDYGSKKGIDPLQEKMLLFYATKEFQFHNVKPYLLTNDIFCISNDTFRIIDSNYNNLDAIVFMYFDQKIDSIWIPSQAWQFYFE